MKRYFKLEVDTGFAGAIHEDFIIMDSDDFESEEELLREVASLALDLKNDNVYESYEELTEEEVEEDYYISDFEEY